MAIYDAFICCSHAKDKPIAAALQSTIQTFGKPWYKRRLLRVYCDDAGLPEAPRLWPAIESALGRSRFLILLASAECARSPWTTKEVASWLQHKSTDTLLIAVMDGELAWDPGGTDFIWSKATPLPAILKGRFPTEPKWVDLRRYRDGSAKRGKDFAQLVAVFAAAIHGVPKEDLLTQEARQKRRALTLALLVLGVVILLWGAAGWQWKAALIGPNPGAQPRSAQP